MPDLQLVRPAPEHAGAYRAALAEFHAEGRLLDVHPDGVLAHIQELRLSRLYPGQYGVCESVYWGLVGGTFVGRINLRHDLTPDLLAWGGHIGYEVRPSRRREGHGHALLRAVLPEARALGLGRVLLSCLESNLASVRIIERAGGQLENVTLAPEGALGRRYWIDLGDGPAPRP